MRRTTAHTTPPPEAALGTCHGCDNPIPDDGTPFTFGPRTYCAEACFFTTADRVDLTEYRTGRWGW